MKMPDSLDQETDILKVYASYILSNISANDTPTEPGSFMIHWQYIDSLTNFYEGERLHGAIEQALNPIHGSLEPKDQKNLSASERSVEYLDTHASRIYETLSIGRMRRA